MKQVTACDRCGLRTVRHELEQRGVVMHFCDECYWGEAQEIAPAEVPGARPVEPAAPRSGGPVTQ
ncbi:MAG TPA: hypothetical protein VGZ23_06865 [bacterium]|nr:hypothetical protein [bacterium]